MSQQVVEQVKADVVARGINIMGACGAAQITVRVGWQLRGDGWGYMRKDPSRTHCDWPDVGKIGTDVLMKTNGQYVDLLIAAGGDEDANGNPIPGTGNIPAWQLRTGANPADWIAPVDVDAGGTPLPPPSGDAVVVALNAINSTLQIINNTIRDKTLSTTQTAPTATKGSRSGRQ